MHETRALPFRVVFLLAVLTVQAGLYLALRLAFLFHFRPADLEILSPPVLKALWLGFRFDLRLSALLLLPVLLLSWIPGLNLARSRLGRTVWILLLTLAQGLVLLAYFVDFGAFSYIRTRLNATLLMFAENANISAQMVHESYPVIPLTLLLLLLLIGLFLLLRWIALRLLRTPGQSRMRGWRSALCHVLLFLLLAGLIYGKLQRYPLRWSDAFVHRDAFVCQLGLNPVLFFFDTLKEEPLNYDREAARRRYPALARYLGVPPEAPPLSLRRPGIPHGSPDQDWNVVLIFLETFAAFKTGILGSHGLDSSPRFDALAREGLLLRRFYVPMENTSRSLFGALFGIPDVSAVNSSSRNPLVVDQHTILNAFQGYEKLYALGGSANWGNIRGMLAHNIEGLKIYEEGDWESPVHDVWGISDADLLRESNRILRDTPEPFFAVLMTAGNHRPFKIPEESYGFRPNPPPEAGLEGSGFYSEEEFRGFQFLDHCLGFYMDLARQEEYFPRTLFVILGDHGTRGGSTDRRFGGLGLPSVHVPLLLYAPGLLDAAVDDRVVSELDLMPSLASLLGKPYVNQTLGRDIFDPTRGQPDCAFTCTPFRHPPRIGLIQGDFYAIRDPDGRSFLHRLSELDSERDLQTEHPERTAEMIHLAEGFYEMARYLLYHNAPPGESESERPSEVSGA